MAEAASDKGGKYYVFYRDIARNVELAARLTADPKQKTPSGKPIHFQIRAKIVHPDGTPHVAHYNCIRSKKTYSFEADEQANYVFENSTTPIRIANGFGANVHGKIASASMQATMLEAMHEITNFPPKNRSKVLKRTPELLENRRKYQQREINEIKQERSEQTDPIHKKQHKEEQARISDAAKDIKPRVFVLNENGLVSRYLYEDYTKTHYTKKPQKSKTTAKEQTLIEEGEKLIREALLDSNKKRFTRAPNTLDMHDHGWDAPKAVIRRKGDKSFRYNCEDALYVQIKTGDQKVEKKAPHRNLALHQPTMQKSDLNQQEKEAATRTTKPTYEVWILDKTPAPSAPHFHIIQYSNHKKQKIKAAARFALSRDDETGNITATLWPYNEGELGASPSTHPSHNMYVNDHPEILQEAQKIAELYARDALVAWKEHYQQDLQQSNMFAGSPTTMRLSQSTHGGYLQPSASQDQPKASATR